MQNEFRPGPKRFESQRNIWLVIGTDSRKLATVR